MCVFISVCLCGDVCLCKCVCARVCICWYWGMRLTYGDLSTSLLGGQTAATFILVLKNEVRTSGILLSGPLWFGWKGAGSWSKRLLAWTTTAQLELFRQGTGTEGTSNCRLCCFLFVKTGYLCLYITCSSLRETNLCQYSVWKFFLWPKYWQVSVVMECSHGWHTKILHIIITPFITLLDMPQVRSHGYCCAACKARGSLCEYVNRPKWEHQTLSSFFSQQTYFLCLLLSQWETAWRCLPRTEWSCDGLRLC